MVPLHPSDGPWFSTKDATKELQISRSTLHRLQKDGHLVSGVHYFKIAPGATSKKLWDINKIRESMKLWTPSANRKVNA